MTRGLNKNDVWESLAEARTVTQEQRETIVRTAEGRQEVKTKGTAELPKEVWVVCEASSRASRRPLEL